jgi:hypothetical protein
MELDVAASKSLVVTMRRMIVSIRFEREKTSTFLKADGVQRTARASRV